MSDRTRPDGAAVLDAVSAFVARFVVMPSTHALHAVVLWCAHAHALAAAEATPYLSVQSPEKRSGKTRLLEVLELLVPRPLRTAGASESALFRSLAEDPPPTLLFDEVDAIFSPRAKAETESLRGLLNAGHRRGATVLRTVMEGRSGRVERFPVFAPKVLAGIGEPPDTITDRAVVLRMRRKAPGERAERFRYRRVEPEAAALAGRLAEWCASVEDEAAGAEPPMPPALDDRAEDGWEPLVALADLAGGPWPGRAREAAVALSAGRLDAEDGTLGVRLLADVRAVFKAVASDRLPSEDLAAALVAMAEAPWGDLYGKPLDARALARLLRPYDVRPKVIRQPDGGTPRGYLREQFEDAWSRYCPTPGDVLGAQHRHVALAEPQHRNIQSPSGVAGVPTAEGYGQEPVYGADVAVLRSGSRNMGATAPANAPDGRHEELVAQLLAGLREGSVSTHDSPAPGFAAEWQEALRRHAEASGNGALTPGGRCAECGVRQSRTHPGEPLCRCAAAPVLFDADPPARVRRGES